MQLGNKSNKKMLKELSYRQTDKRNTRGFSIIEILIVVLILAIITTLSLMGITQARTSLQFSNAVGTLQIYLEKAISDAKRRNAKGDLRTPIRVLNTKSYEVKIDFDGDGNPEIQTIDLPQQTTFLYDSANPPKATIDWRGNIAEGNVTFVLKSTGGQVSEVKLTGKGDASTDSQFPTMPTITVSPISSDVKSSTVLAGNSTPNPNISPTPTPTPLPFCSGSELPAVNNCRCKPGKVIKSDGKCS